MRFSKLAVALVLVAMFVVLSGPASAQYFGRNKVKWDDFRFQVLQTQHFDIHYYPEQKDAAEDVARMAERWYARYSKFFNHEFTHKPIVLYADHPDFQQTTTIDSTITEGLGGFTDAFQNRIVMPLTGVYAETDHVLGHEMVHVFQYDIALTRSKSQIGEKNANFRLMSLPLWMVEGLAEYLSQGRVDPQTAMWVRDATISDKLPDREKLTNDPRFSPYQYGQAFWAWVGGRWGDEAVRELFLGAGAYGIDEAFRKIVNMPSKDAFAEWQKVSKEQYAVVLKDRTLPSAMGTPLVTPRKRTFGSNVDLAPSLSPDGKWLAFLSARGLFSIDLFLANAETGEVVAELAGAKSDPHFDALRFIDSAGSWAPDSESFAFVVFEAGDNRLAILDVENRKVTERIELPGIGAITNPAWSPDGQSIAFSGQAGGITDIYLMDVETKKITRLTNDRYGDLQPAWSPDGKQIAFVSERGEGTDLTQLKYGPLKISVIDVASKEIRTLAIFDIARHINPQWAPDGQSIWFIADPDGFSDIFQYDLESGQIHRRTNVATGVAGITNLSPALTVAARKGNVVYSLFDDGGWELYALDPKKSPSTEISFVSKVDAPGATLPPTQAVEPIEVATYLDKPSEGLLPPNTGYTAKKYDRSLHLDYVGPPTVGVGVDSRGVGVGGSIALGFSDVLGTHKVGLFLQGGGTTSSLEAIFGGQVYYLNQANRFQWGGSVTHLPYSTRYTLYDQRTVVIDGQPVPAEVYQEVEERTTLDEAAIITQYPLGPTRRIEATAGFNHLGYEIGVDEFIYVNGQLADTDSFTVDSLESLGYFRGAAAFVGDSSLFGIASPIAGTRYRFEVAQNTGDLDYNSLLADYRKYFFHRPFTLAFRGLYLGRQGESAEDPRLNALDVSNATLVRGYQDYGQSECTPTPGPGSGCPEIARLLGSKMAVFNIEFRVPLFGPREFGLITAPYFPTELVAFLDGGSAWTEDESTDWSFETETTARVPVFSAGIATRVVLGGVLPLQFYYAYPFQRPEKSSGEFGFLIIPGW